MKIFYNLLVCTLMTTLALGQTEITVTDADLVGGEEYSWTKDNVYLLDGYVFLEEGGILNIEAGTVIKGIADPSNTDITSALLITRGAQIFAEGTASEPIIFTAEDDDVNDPSDFGPEDRGEWGGLIVLGRATISDNVCAAEIEGVKALANDTRVRYGDENCEFDDEDNSGIIRYVSVRHGGSILEDGDEINGITFGAVGSGTTVEYVEVYANDDDGIEWFGGTVNVKYAAVAFCADDTYDWDDGFRGYGQFWFSIQGLDDGGNGGEHDGAHPDDNEPPSDPTVYNATYIGMGATNTADPDAEYALLMRDGTAGDYANSIFTEFPFHAIEVEDRASGVDSRQRMEDGDLTLKNNIWFGFGSGDQVTGATDNNSIIGATGDAEDPDAMFLVNHLASNNNTIADPLLAGVSRTTNNGLDPRPFRSGPAYEDVLDVPNDPFFTPTRYRGAFGSRNWMEGWTALSAYGHLQETTKQDIVITDADLQGGQEYTWTSDNCYLLDGYVFLEEGGTLYIEEGTVIKGLADPSNTDITSALIITRGAQIFAEGTREAPIIFTAEDDDLSINDDLGPEDRGEWGGLILLGRATISDNVCAAEIEGVKALANDTRVRYGDENCEFKDDDNSGVLRYVSVRHGGSVLEDGDEINGITFGAVGSGTIVEYVEVYANDDDGIEWFGGTVDVRFAAVSYCADDTYDWDDGYRGRGQFWFSIQGLDDGGNGGEHDGAHPDDNDPPSDPTVYNATYIGMGANNTADPDAEYALLMRDGTAGDYGNSIFTDFPFHAIEVEDRASGVDSRQRMEDGDLTLKNNIWWNFGSGDQLVPATDNRSIIGATGDAEDPDAMFLVDHLAQNGNTLEDPMINNISRITDNTLDPRPAMGGAAMNGVQADFINNDDDFFVPVRFKGAFCGMGTWLNDWTALWANDHLDKNIPWADHNSCDLVDVEDIYEADEYVTIGDVQPNPAFDRTSLKMDLAKASDVNIVLYNTYGAQVRSVFNGRLNDGEHVINIDLAGVDAGTYMTMIRVDGRAYSIRLIVQ